MVPLDSRQEDSFAERDLPSWERFLVGVQKDLESLEKDQGSGWHQVVWEVFVLPPRSPPSSDNRVELMTWVLGAIGAFLGFFG